MENNFEDVKVLVRSLLTSSKSALSIDQLQKDYRDLEGSNLPYKRLGFTSVVQLLQKMDDVLTLPSNPTNSSIISLVASDKTSHIRELIVKQKSNTKGRKANSSLSTRNGYHTNININRPVIRNNFNKVQSYVSRNIAKTNRASQIENRVCRQGFVTKELRLFIEKNIKKNKMLITIDMLRELVKNHPDGVALKPKCLQDIIDLFKDFLTINKTGVSLKHICQSTTNKCNSPIDNKAEISSSENKYIPVEVLFNIYRIFKVYCEGVNIENYLFIYYKMYYTHFDSTAYGFTSTINMLQGLGKMIEIRNNVMYTKKEFACNFPKYEENSLKNDQMLMIQKNVVLSASSSNALAISLDVDEAVVKDHSKMVLAEVFNPSAFYLQLAYRNAEFDRLTKQMQLFYDKEKIKCHVQSEQILLGSVYATSFSLNVQKGLWYRVRVLKEINSTTVNVIYVDYGTIKDVPKTELRFLKYEFCQLPCQAVHCCLTGYNELEAFEPEVTKEFLNIVNNEPVLVQIDVKFILEPQCQILHVTLFKSPSSKCSINDELTMQL